MGSALTTLQELREVERAACVDPFGAYFINGNAYWTPDKVIEWWEGSKERVDYIVKVYQLELEGPDVYPRARGADESRLYRLPRLHDIFFQDTCGGCYSVCFCSGFSGGAICILESRIAPFVSMRPVL